MSSDKIVSTGEFIKILKIRSSHDLYPVRTNSFVEGTHYKKISPKVFHYNLTKILENFPWFTNEQPERYTLKYIEDYLTPLEIKKIFRIKGKSMRFQFMYNSVYFELERNVHYFKLSDSYSVYDWDNICKSFPVTEEINKECKKILNKRHKKREFSLVSTQNWDLIRKFVGERNPTEVFPKDIRNPLIYINKIALQRLVPKKVDTYDLNSPVPFEVQKTKNYVKKVERISTKVVVDTDDSKSQIPPEIVSKINKYVDEVENIKKKVTIDKRKVMTYLSQLLGDIKDSKKVEFDVVEEIEEKIENFERQSSKRSIIIELATIS